MIDLDGRNISDGRYRDVKEDEDFLKADALLRSSTNKSNLPACLSAVTLDRHTLLKEKASPEIEKLQMELEIDKELGLMSQAENTAKKALKLDIDELTKSNSYFQVSKSLLERLFSIRQLRMMCWSANIEAFFNALFPPCLNATILTAMTVVASPILIMLSVHFFGHVSTTPFNVIMITATCLGWISVVVSSGFAIQQWSKVKIGWDAIDVRLNSVPLITVKEKIPLGAKMKVLEAKRTNIFEDFVYVHPLFSVERKEIEVKKYIPRIQTDPAILGVTRDKRMFMVVYWDVKNDVERVIKEINDFKKFKVVE